VPDTLSVDLNRRSVHSIEAPERFETSESFVIELTNHGEAAHVHVNVDENLSGAVAFDGGNHFIQAGRTRRIEAAVDRRSRPVSGRLKIITGYGAEAVYVDVSLVPSNRSREKPPVEIDESLSMPQPRQGTTPRNRGRSGRGGRGGSGAGGRTGAGAGTGTGTRGGLDPSNRTIAAAGLVAFSLLLVVLVALITGSPAVILAVGIVLVGVAGAAALLWNQS
jgi:hypothetical protein